MKRLLIVTAVLEAGAGVALLMTPSLVAYVLLGTGLASPEAMMVGRVGGAALLAIGASCWLERHWRRGSPVPGVVGGALVYNAIVAALLFYAAAAVNMTGMLTWPAIVLHAGMFVWCAGSLRASGA